MTRIAGILTEAPADRAEAAVRGLLRRYAGPEGLVRLGPAALGARGAAPLVRDGLAVVADGVFYNREDLGPGTEAEVLLRLYQSHGFEGALARINGDFACALYDLSEDVLWLGRDRFGLRPLYWAKTPEGVAFASTPRGLADLTGRAQADIRFAAVFAGCHYRLIDNRPEDSPYQGVSQVPAGRLLRLAKGRADLRQWWTLAEAPDFAEPEEELAERYRDLFLDAVRLRFAAAERPVFTLSGGMDSSSVLSAAVRLSGRKQHAVSTVYDDKTYDESDDIRTILDAAVEVWRTVRIGVPDVFGLVERMVALHEEPVATATWLSHYLLCGDVAAAGYGGLFGGLGGDELNAGEYEYFPAFFADLRAMGREDLLAAEVAEWARHHDHPVHRKSPAVAEDMLRRLTDPARPGRLLPEPSRVSRYAAAVNPDRFDVRGLVPVMDHPFGSCLKNRTFQDLFRETAPCCLRAEDRHAEAFGLGRFLPFFDHRLAEFMFRVPGTMKIRLGVTKHLLRLAMRGVLAESTRTRIKKTGWNAPAHVWFSGEGLDAVRDLVASRSFRERGIYVPAEVERILADHERILASGAAEENHMMFLWQLVNLETWLAWIDRTGPGGEA